MLYKHKEIKDNFIVRSFPWKVAFDLGLKE